MPTSMSVILGCNIPGESKTYTLGDSDTYRNTIQCCAVQQFISSVNITTL